jgi:glycine cleavage system H protein
MRMTQDGVVMVGIDEFAAGVIGEVSAIKLPRYFRKVRQGEPSFTFDNNGRSVTFVSPLTGRVVEKNEMIRHDPALAILSPLHDGWLFKVDPADLQIETRNLLTGNRADLWMDMARTHLLRFFSASPVPVSQDGGRLVTDLAHRCSEAEWIALKRELFLDTGGIDRQQQTTARVREEVAP